MEPGVVRTLVTIAAYLFSQSSGGVSPVATPSGGSGGARSVIGYYSEYYPGESRPYKALQNHAKTLTAIAPFAYYLDGNGNLSGTKPTRAIAAAKSSGLQVLALIHNFTRQNGFEGWVAHKMLSSPLARGRAVSRIVSLVRTTGYNGINLDLENVPARDRANYTAFIRELSQALRPAGI